MTRTKNGGCRFGTGFERLEERAVPATLGDRVWLDGNGNGVQDGGEGGVAGIEVMLHKGYPSAGPLFIAKTNANGNYAFPLDGLPAGSDYWVQLGPLPYPTGGGYGYALSPTDVGSDAADSDFYSQFLWTNYLTVTPGVTNLNVDAGLVPLPGPVWPTVGDRVWHDANANGLQDNAEGGVPGVPVRLVRGGVVVATTTTDAGGFYAFATNGLPASNLYWVEVSVPSGWALAPANVTGGFAEQSDNDFYGPGWTDYISLGGFSNVNFVDAGLVRVAGRAAAAGVAAGGLSAGDGAKGVPAVPPAQAAVSAGRVVVASWGRDDGRPTDREPPRGETYDDWSSPTPSVFSFADGALDPLPFGAWMG